MAAALQAKENGVKKILILERAATLGGILEQCIHAGFGLHYFGEELTGPEYAHRFIEQVEQTDIEVKVDTMVLEIRTGNIVIATNAHDGMLEIHATAIILAMGCRERPRGALDIPGSRASGIMTAGTAQKYVNIDGYMPGKKIVILGSGDIGLIMARRMTLEGAEVVMVVELMDYLAGLTRNRVQCLDDFGIPLKLGHTITRIEGDARVTGVYVAPVDENKKPILEKEEYVPCDTVLFSVGLIPENELTRKSGIAIERVTNGPAVNQYMQTSAPSVFACGNVVHVNDLADNVSEESARAGKYAALYALGRFPKAEKAVQCVPGRNVRYLCPQKVCVGAQSEKTTLYFRVLQPEENVKITARCGDAVLVERKAFRVNPGEMEHVTVESGKLAGEEITVEVAKEG
jgi:NADPH-dependent 2,4-dienoyl-CoA reductase/sulfur reductase-like enzyme